MASFQQFRNILGQFCLKLIPEIKIVSTCTEIFSLTSTVKILCETRINKSSLKDLVFGSSVPTLPHFLRVILPQ